MQGKVRIGDIVCDGHPCCMEMLVEDSGVVSLHVFREGLGDFVIGFPDNVAKMRLQMLLAWSQVNWSVPEHIRGS